MHELSSPEPPCDPLGTSSDLLLCPWYQYSFAPYWSVLQNENGLNLTLPSVAKKEKTFWAASPKRKLLRSVTKEKTFWAASPKRKLLSQLRQRKLLSSVAEEKPYKSFQVVRDKVHTRDGHQTDNRELDYNLDILYALRASRIQERTIRLVTVRPMPRGFLQYSHINDPSCLLRKWTTLA